MSPTIVLLPPELASQIAAGEVVERPASVVKELVENALDAGARRIEVSIEGGGITRIEICDDGHGMSPADAVLAVQRHATSKLRTIEDLQRLRSYGFRGEALPSIASVSRFSLRTRARSSDSGSELELPASDPTPQLRPVGAPIGTTIVVAELFYNVPARRKFLRSTGTESGHVGDVIEGAALSRPDVAFSLRRDARLVRSYARAAERAERVAQILNGEALSEVRGERGPLRVEAFLSTAERARQGAGALSLILNGRPIKDRSLAATIAHAYGEALERGRYPRGVVYLELEPDLVDVNVHPQKTEVRFADPRAVADALYKVVSRGLATEIATRGGAPAEPRGRGAVRTGAQPAQAPDAAPSAADSATPPPQTTPRRSSHWTHTKPSTLALRDVAARAPTTAGGPGPEEEIPESEPPSSEPEGAGTAGGWKKLRYVARLRGRYLVCEGEDGVYLLDAQATRRAVLQAELWRGYSEGNLRSQALLFPLTLELAPTQVELIERESALLHRLGLDLRGRGALAISVHTLPTRLERSSPDSIARAVVEALDTSGSDDVRAALALARCVEIATRPGQGGASVEGDPRSLVTAFARLELSEAERARLVLFSASFAALSRKVEG